MVGWKVHRLTKKEFCHSNETWQALNSTFPDTNCIVSFQINPHWISNSGLWKVVLETFQRRPGKLTKRVLFHQDNAPAHKFMVAMAAVRECGFELVDDFPYSPDLAPSDYFLFSQMKKIWLGSSIRLMMTSYLPFRTFSRIRKRASIPQYSKCCNTNRRSVWTEGETILKNKPHLVKFYHCSTVSLSIFFSPLLYFTKLS